MVSSLDGLFALLVYLSFGEINIVVVLVLIHVYHLLVKKYYH